MAALRSKLDMMKEARQCALVLYVMAGDPDLASIPDILDLLAESGADVIELGLPFSDPVADGPVIQAAAFRALQGGASVEKVLARLAEWPNSKQIPVVLMGYLNPILRFGYARFARLAKESGASGILISDLIPEEAEEWLTAASANDLDTVFLAAPTSPDDRLQLICESSTGFVYAVSRTGVTGAGSSQDQAGELVHKLRERTSNPICVGFGVSGPEQAKALQNIADGVIVGSALVSQIHQEFGTPEGREKVGQFVRSLNQSLQV